MFRQLRLTRGHAAPFQLPLRAAARSFTATRARRLGVPGQIFDDPTEDDKNDKKSETKWRDLAFKATETAAVMVASIAMLGLAGLMYHRYYRAHAHSKMLEAFEGEHHCEDHRKNDISDSHDWVWRPQQDILNHVVDGQLNGRYYLLFGEKGTGKTSMLLHAIRRVHGHNVVVIDAHADPEIFRIRMGKALNFEFFEDYLGSLFSIRGPRETSALLDIERAFNTLEDVAVQRQEKSKKNTKPLILIINNAHLIRDDEEGRDLIELLQQKAESLSGSGLCSMIFNSDDYWLYQRLKRLGTRLDVISVGDFNREQSISALKSIRRRAFGEILDDETALDVYHLVGGRAQHLGSVAYQKNIIQACHSLIDREKQWFLNHCGLLGDDMDDDVMDFGKFSSAAMVLAKEMVNMSNDFSQDGDIKLPRIPLWRARQIMTRPDFIQEYDNLNLFTLDEMSRVKPDSVVMFHAFKEIVSMPGFNELLNQTLSRVDAIESLGRTRELVAKDLVLGGKYLIQKVDGKDAISLDAPAEDDDDDDEMMLLDQTDKFYWKKRNLRKK